MNEATFAFDGLASAPPARSLLFNYPHDCPSSFACVRCTLRAHEAWAVSLCCAEPSPHSLCTFTGGSMAGSSQAAQTEAQP